MADIVQAALSTPIIQFDYLQFTPDYKMLEYTRSIRTQRYNLAKQKFANLYYDILYSPLTREDTQKYRDEYLNNYEGSIKRITELDLSQPENVNIAYKLFEPIYNNSLFVKDKLFTSKLKDEINKHNSLELCVDSSNCDYLQAREESIKALNYKMKEFRDADAKSALYMPLPKYVPGVDVGNYLNKKFKDYGYNIKNVSLSPDGRFIITSEDGRDVTTDYFSVAMSFLAENQLLKDFNATKAYVLRKEMELSAPDNVAFVNSYISEFNKYSEKLGLYKEILSSQLDILNKQKEAYTDVVNGTIKEGKTTKQGKETAYKALNGIQYINNQIERINKMIDALNVNKINIKANLIKTGVYDKILGDAMMLDDLFFTANAWASGHKEVSMKENLFALEEEKAKHAAQLEILKAKIDAEKEKAHMRAIYEVSGAVDISPFVYSKEEKTEDGKQVDIIKEGYIHIKADVDDIRSMINDGINNNYIKILENKSAFLGSLNDDFKNAWGNTITQVAANENYLKELSDKLSPFLKAKVFSEINKPNYFLQKSGDKHYIVQLHPLQSYNITSNIQYDKVQGKSSGLFNIGEGFLNPPSPVNTPSDSKDKSASDVNINFLSSAMTIYEIDINNLKKNNPKVYNVISELFKEPITYK